MSILAKKGNGNVLGFIRSCLSALQTLNNKHYSFTTDISEDLKYNPQKINIQKRLNDLYDNELRRIYLSNQSGLQTLYIYDLNEQQTDYIFDISEGEPPVYVGDTNEEVGDYDFIVYIPTGFLYNEEQFRATVDRYKFDSIRYDIKTY